MFNSWFEKIRWRRDRLPTPAFLSVSRVAQLVKTLPEMRETQVRSLGWEDPLEKGMATHSSIAWRAPWTVQFASVATEELLLPLAFHVIPPYPSRVFSLPLIPGE